MMGMIEQLGAQQQKMMSMLEQLTGTAKASLAYVPWDHVPIPQHRRASSQTCAS